jgi:hypothetical protein
MINFSYINTNVLQHFSKATSPVSFFVYVYAFGRGNVNGQDIRLDNGQTNERLVVKTWIPPIDPLLLELFGDGLEKCRPPGPGPIPK